MFVVAVIALAILSLLVVTLPITIPALIYVVGARNHHKLLRDNLAHVTSQRGVAEQELHAVRTTLSQTRQDNEDLRAMVERLDGMSMLQRQEEIARLDQAFEHQQKEHAAQLREHEAQIAAALHKEDAELQRLKDKENAQLANLREQTKNVQKDLSSYETKVLKLQETAVNLEEMVNLNDYGLYNFENPAADSVRFADELKTVRTKIKSMVKEKTATSATKDWTVNGSAVKGRKMVNDMSKLLLRAFNAEAENSVKTVRAGHLSTALKRLDRSAEAIARLGKMMDLRVSERYIRLREEELRITHAHLETTKAAKELEREERARAREERQAQKELAAAKAKQVKEVEHYRTVMETLQESQDADALAAAAADLAAAEEKLSDVESTMANTRAGYVYVISNRGAFGEGIIKIGMTRRLNPMDRVRELGDASVPFNFDTHTMIFAKDAIGLERALHREFADVRLNLINLRREYFYATPSEVKDILVKLHADYDAQLLEFHDTADATEYVASEDLRSTGSIPQPANL